MGEQGETKDMAKRITGDQLRTKMSNTGNGLGMKDILVDFKVDKNNPVVNRTLRLIGDAVGFRAAQAKKRNETDPKAPLVPTDFPDKELNRSFTRICNDDPKQDYWTQEGYVSTQRYAINVIERGTDGAPDSIKILEKGKTIFEEFTNKENFNKGLNAELAKNGKPLLWEEYGGEDAPDWVITATYTPGQIGNVTYTVNVMPYTSKITEEEIELLKATGQLSKEQLAAIRAENPDLATKPDWMFFGHDLEKRFAPTPLRISAASAVATTPDELVMSVAGEDEEDEVDAPAPAPTAGKVRGKAAEVAAAPADDLDF